jgi:hypothetical protein
MKIDIDQLTEAELIDLNHRIVARLRFLTQMRAHVEMMEFKIGDRVTFQPPGHGPVEGMLTRYNKKTVTTVTDQGSRMRVWDPLLGVVSETSRLPPEPGLREPCLSQRRTRPQSSLRACFRDQ